MIAVCRQPKSAKNYQTLTRADLMVPGELGKVVLDTSPHSVVHLAAVTSHATCTQDPQLALRVNAQATREVVEACETTGAHLVYISTDAVFSGKKGLYLETDQPDPNSMYGETKLLGEEYVKSYTKSLIIRTNFFGFGGRAKPSILEFFLSGFARGLPLQGFARYVVTSMYAGSLAQIIWELLDRQAVGLLHAGSSDALSKLEFGGLVAREFRLNGAHLTPCSEPCLDLSLNSGKLERILGKSLPTQVEGIREARVESAGWDWNAGLYETS